MKAVAALLLSLAGCSFFAGRNQSPTSRPSCDGLETAVVLDKVVAGAMGATAIGGLVLAGLAGRGSGNAPDGGGIAVLGISLPAAVIGAIYIASSKSGRGRLDSCRHAGDKWDAVTARADRQRLLEAQLAHVRAVAECRSRRDDGIDAARSMESAARISALEALPRCAEIDRSEHIRDLRIAVLLAALRGDCEETERLVTTVRVNDSSLGLVLDRSPEILACLERMHATRATRRVETREACVQQRAIKLREANALAPAVRARAILAIPTCD